MAKKNKILKRLNNKIQGLQVEITNLHQTIKTISTVSNNDESSLVSTPTVSLQEPQKNELYIGKQLKIDGSCGEIVSLMDLDTRTYMVKILEGEKIGRIEKVQASKYCVNVTNP